MKKFLSVLTLCLICVCCAVGLTACNGYQTTSDEYFNFIYLQDTDSYSINVKDKSNLPENIVLPSEYDGKKITHIGYDIFTEGESPFNTQPNINYAFSKCNKLKTIVIPDSVTSIGAWAFSSCSSLTSITIPDSVTSIGNSAFYNCSNLMSITIPDSVTSIGEEAFRDCYSLTSVTIGNSVTSIGNYAFSGCYNLTSIIVLEDNSKYSSLDGILYNKDKTEIIQVPQGISGAITLSSYLTNIGYKAFSGCHSLTSITISDSVTSIGSGAFSYCSSLTSITIDENNKYYKSTGGNLYSKDGTTLIQYTIGKPAIKFIIPDSVTSIGDRAFYNCSSLTSITIPDSVTSIGNEAFYNCSSLMSIIIPDSVTSLGWYAFYNCSSLMSITIPNSVTGIGSSVFNGCKSLTSITIGDGVTSIGQGAFYDCSSLTSIIIPDGVTNIGEYAFTGCSSLTSLIIGCDVISIGYGVLSSCSGLTSITVDENNKYYKSIDGSLYSKDGKTLMQYAIGKTATEFTIPDGVTSIYNNVFSGCSSLKSITIPDRETCSWGITKTNPNQINTSAMTASSF